jgi:creatinine amidohydrolase/Fe(II)-dependent formamide hydrolase-like protein
MSEERRRGADRRRETRTASPGRRASDAGSEADPLRTLLVLDRLEVGPPKVETRRVITPYTVRAGKHVDTFEFIYRYEEDVFDPSEPGSMNLAAMLTAQVALNYGLFAREIVFAGAFDRHDRRFLADMARNTAREIVVKKFLEPNPFLIGPAANLSAVERETYLQAELRFPDAEDSGRRGGPRPDPWRADPSRHAVLSSGGKDSLLSFGLLREMGKEPHAIFVNESGKHWFTALNAYQSQAARYSETARVWTNSDRLFAWMARRLPFIREDFQKLRADEYPVRLWTVAVFLFGALPLLRKRGIGRLAIGDEYDTSRKAVTRGIPHYDGLYDQSIYFDQALSRYYRLKGWGLSQFSLLRPMSEMLIEKTLVERYPDLQQDQVSCHAAHKEADRVHPCGQCEKCRRIVSMLSAFGADPGRCGYSKEQIERSLAWVAEKGVHQEADDAEHLAFLLERAGRITGPAPGLPAAKEHPEIMKLRFDPERSPATSIPVDLREPLYRILLEHAGGAARKSGRVWLDYDPFGDPALMRPYRFESPGKGTAEASTRAGESRGYLLGELTWPQAETLLKRVDVALLPVGSIEQHGPHLPLDTDAFDADYLSREVAKACSDPKPLVLPLIPYGVSYHHDDFRGTLSVSPETLSRLVYEIGMNAARNGVTKLVIVNGHGGNAPSLHFAAQMINRDAHIFTCVDTGESSDQELEAMSETRNDVHAGEIETSTTLAVRPDLVDLKRARKFVPRFSNDYLEFSSGRSVGWYARTAKISTSGVLGDPTKASREKGEKMWAVMIRNLVELVEDIKGMSLDEIYHQRL